MISVRENIFRKIKDLIKLTFFSVKEKINMNNRKYCFEIFGFDLIMDSDLNVFILEVNTNPGLEESSPIIKTLVPRMIDDALKLTIDDIFENKLTINRDFVTKTNLSHFPVEGYSDEENMWELVTDFSDYVD